MKPRKETSCTRYGRGRRGIGIKHRFWARRRGIDPNFTKYVMMPPAAAEDGGVDPLFTGYEIRYKVLDGNRSTEHDLAGAYYWRTPRDWHKEDPAGFLKRCKQPLLTKEGARRTREAIASGGIVTNPHYAFDAYRLVDGKYLRLDEAGYEIPAYASNAEPLEFGLHGISI